MFKLNISTLSAAKQLLREWKKLQTEEPDLTAVESASRLGVSEVELVV